LNLKENKIELFWNMSGLIEYIIIKFIL
jgi:hypothetical protein